MAKRAAQEEEAEGKPGNNQRGAKRKLRQDPEDENYEDHDGNQGTGGGVSDISDGQNPSPADAFSPPANSGGGARIILGELEVLDPKERLTRLTELVHAMAFELERKDSIIHDLTKEVRVCESCAKRQKLSSHKAKQNESEAPKKPLSGYIMFMKDKVMKMSQWSAEALKGSDIEKQMERVLPAAVVTEVENEWKELPDTEKMFYGKRAEKDKERYNDEMASYKPQEQQAPSRRRRNMTGYNIFYSYHVNTLRSSESDLPSERGSVARVVGEAWKKLSKLEKKAYNQFAAAHADKEAALKNAVPAALKSKEEKGGTGKPTPSERQPTSEDAQNGGHGYYQQPLPPQAVSPQASLMPQAVLPQTSPPQYGGSPPHFANGTGPPFPQVASPTLGAGPEMHAGQMGPGGNVCVPSQMMCVNNEGAAVALKNEEDKRSTGKPTPSVAPPTIQDTPNGEHGYYQQPPSPQAGPPLAVLPQAVMPQAVMPQAVMPQDVPPQAVVPQAVMPQAVPPQAVVPQAVVPQAVSPQAVMPPAVSPQAVPPQHVMPQALMPQAVSPQTVLPPAVSTQAVLPQDVLPQALMPPAVSTQAVLPQDVLPQAVSTQAVPPQDVMPQALMPRQAVSPQAVSPQAVLPQAVLPQAGIPHTGPPQAGLPQTSLPQPGGPQPPFAYYANGMGPLPQVTPPLLQGGPEVHAGMGPGGAGSGLIGAYGSPPPTAKYLLEHIEFWRVESASPQGI